MSETNQTTNTLKFTRYKSCLITLYNQEHRVLLKEPSLIALDTQNGNILAIGSEALFMQEKKGTAVVGSPFKNGVVADFELASKLLQTFLKRVSERKSFFFRPRIAACVPIDLTPVERQALDELLHRAGAKSVLILEDTFARSSRNIPESYHFILEITPDEE